jgi:hypothetical protein
VVRSERPGLETYKDSGRAPFKSDFAFLGFNALRFIVAVIAVLALVLVPDLKGASDAPVRSLDDRESPLRSELFATNTPHAILDQTLWHAGPTAAPRTHAIGCMIWVAVGCRVLQTKDREVSLQRMLFEPG